MAYIFDPTYEVREELPILTIGSLVYVGSVIIDRKRDNIGIIIGVDKYNFGLGECNFFVYTDGQIIKTSKVFLVW